MSILTVFLSPNWDPKLFSSPILAEWKVVAASYARGGASNLCAAY